MGHALRKALGVIAVLQGRGQAAGTAVAAAQAGVPQLGASSLKAALDADWDDPAGREAALAEVLRLLDQVEAFIAGLAGDQAAGAAVRTARQVAGQDIDLAGPALALRRGVARDRRISVEDAQMRHGRKSRSVLFDGYKRHVLRDLDTGLVPAVGITAANLPEASVTADITADLEAAGRQLAELHIDRAYLASALVRDRSPDLVIFCKAWRVRNTGLLQANPSVHRKHHAPRGARFSPARSPPYGRWRGCSARSGCRSSPGQHLFGVHCQRLTDRDRLPRAASHFIQVIHRPQPQAKQHPG